MVTWYKLPVILGGALIVTALGIDAADTTQGSRSTLLASVFSATQAPRACSEGMTPVWFETGVVCVDVYEASVSDLCIHREPTGEVYTEDNLKDGDCVPQSVPRALPWRFVTRTQAEQLCARAGKQLITPAVWYNAALGVIENDCNSAGTLAPTGSFAGCVSGVGARDMVGNVWEWVQGDVQAGVFAGTQLPDSGYVSLVDSVGIALETTQVGTSTFASDYIWTSATGTTAVLRGGFYGGRSDTGIYTVHAGVRSDFASAAVGFRCMQPRI